MAMLNCDLSVLLPCCVHDVAIFCLQVWTFDKVFLPTVLVDTDSRKEALDDLAWVQHVATSWQHLPDPAVFQHSDAISKMRWRKAFVQVWCFVVCLFVCCLLLFLVGVQRRQQRF